MVDIQAFARKLSDVTYPPGAMLLLDAEDYQELRDHLLQPPGLMWFSVRGAEDSELQVAETEVYDRGAYKRANEVMNERLRPRGVQMTPYECSSETCGQKILLVTKHPKATAVCDDCGGQMQRSVT